MVNYNNGKIYKIVSNNGEEIYIGSTTKKYLCDRMVQHRCGYKRWKEGKMYKIVTSFNLFEKYGVENCRIVLLELVNCDSKDELQAKERFYIESLKCVNKIIPTRTDKEWREANKDKIKELKKQYYENNKDKIKESHKEYREANKENKKEYYKGYYKANKEQIKKAVKEYGLVPFHCDCGSVVCIHTKARHFRSIKHKNFIKEKTIII